MADKVTVHGVEYEVDDFGLIAIKIDHRRTRFVTPEQLERMENDIRARSGDAPAAGLDEKVLNEAESEMAFVQTGVRCDTWGDLKRACVMNGSRLVEKGDKITEERDRISDTRPRPLNTKKEGKTLYFT